MLHRSRLPRLLALLALCASTGSAAAPTATGGPDGGGYSYADSTVGTGPGYNPALFTAAPTLGTLLATASNADDTSDAVTLPFSFTFYGTAYTTIYVCSDGYVAFSSTCSLSNTTVATNTQAMIAPFWDDLDTRGAGVVYSWTSGTAPYRVQNIVFIDNTHWNYTSAYGNVSFAVQLYETYNDITMHFADVVMEGTSGSSYSYGLSATTAIDGGSTTTSGLTYNYNSAQLVAGTAVGFWGSTRTAPVAEANGPYSTSEGGTVTVSGVGSSGGNITYEYDCAGDGTFESGLTSATSYACTFADNGTFSSKVRITDGARGTTDSATTTVANVAPTILSVNYGGTYTSVAFGTSGAFSTFTLNAREGDFPYITATASDVAADTVTIAHSWGDGTTTNTASGTAPSHAYADEGSYTVTILAKDEDGGSTDAGAAIGYLLYMNISNVAPTITAATASTVSEGANTTFASTVTDPGTSDVISYSWNFGDGSTSTSANPTHAYADDGSYSWTLTVDDGDGGTATSSGTATVNNISPTISSATIPSGAEGVSLSFSAVAAAGPSDTLSYAWNFGDGSTATGATATHTYTDNGAYTVTLTVTDDDGTTATYTGVSTITNVAPTISAATSGSGYEGAAVAMIATATAGAYDTLTYAWNFGDGSTGSGATTTHIYSDAGTYIVTLTVTDDDGSTATWSSSSTILNVAPTFSSVSIGSGSEGSAVAFTAAATSGTGDTFTYAWNFGDGSTGTGASTTHTYADDGLYTVTVTVTDDDATSTSQTGTSTITNVSPTVSTLTAGSGAEGATLTMVAAATDPGTSDTLSYAWTFGDGSTATTSAATTTHAYADEGSYTVTVVVTDGDGGSGTKSSTSTVTNVAPVIGTFSVATTGTEGTAISASAAATDAGTADTLTYTWSWGDGSTSTGASATHAYVNDGTYTVLLTVTDGDGASATRSSNTVISGVAPVIGTISAPSAVDEGSSGSFVGLATDAGTADTLTYLWDWNDGTTSTGASASHTWTDDGLYMVTLTVADEDGLSSSSTFAVTVNNVDPVLGTIVVSAANEGIAQTLSVAVSDVGTADTFSYAWDFGDGSTSTSASPSHAWPDNGSYTVTLLVIDSDGGTASTTASVTISNVAPVISTSPALTATEGVTYTYNPAATDVAADAPTWSLSAGPAAMSINTGTGALSWSPTWEDAAAPAAVTLVVNDGDGGSVSQSFSITVTAIDTDGDGLPDGYEDLVGLNKNDAADALADTDADGISNLDEFNAGTDPTAYEGPSAPALLAPIAGDYVDTLTPDLEYADASSPRGIALTYEVEVYSDAGLTTLVAGASDLAATTGDELWTVDVPLADNTLFYWRARANDGYIDGPWTDADTFYVNTAADAPSLPVLFQPIGGDIVTTVSPELMWTVSTDPEGDLITYDVQVWDEAGTTLITEATDVTDDTLDAYGTWTVDLALTEDVIYAWTVRAVDATGTMSPWAPAETFHVSTSNAAPSDVSWLSPVEGDVLVELSPSLSWTASVDPEGTTPTYEVQADIDAGFATAVSFAAPSNSLDLAAAGGALIENSTNFLRVRATDGDGVPSSWSVVSVFARGENDAPSAPTLMTLTDGEVTDDATPSLTFGASTDLDLDPITYEITLSMNADLSGGTQSGELTVADGVGAWDIGISLSPGTYYWTATATDAEGASTAAETWSFTVSEDNTGDDTGTTDGSGDGNADDTGAAADDGGKGGCGCATTSPSGAAAMGLLAGLALVSRRRRA